MRYYHFLLFFLLFHPSIRAQENAQKNWNALTSYPLEYFLSDLENTYHVEFNYLEETVENKYVHLKKGQYSLPEIMKKLEEDLSLQFIQSNAEEYLVLSEKKTITAANTKITAPKKRQTCLLSGVENLDRVLLRAYLSLGLSKNRNQAYFIQPNRLGIIPGMTEPDILTTVQNLPGVTSANNTATEINVRGGESDQNLVLWDGISIWDTGHLYGMISAFNPNIKQNIYFFDKATPPEFGTKISSTIDIQTDSNIPDNSLFQAGANALNADVFAHLPLIKKKVSFQFSARRSFTDLWSSPTLDSYSKKVFEFSNESRENRDEPGGSQKEMNTLYYQDYNAKINFKPYKNTELQISSIYIDSHLDVFNVSGNTASEDRDVLNTFNYGYSLTWKQNWSKFFHQRFRVYNSQYQLGYENERHSVTDMTIYKTNGIHDAGIDYKTELRLAPFNYFISGYAFNILNINHKFTLHTDTYDVILDERDDRLKSHAFYTYYKYFNHDKFNVMAGFRYQYFFEKNASSFEPRYLIRFALYKNLYLNQSGEYTSQPVNRIKETIFSEIGVENRLWALSNFQSIPLLRARHFSLGLSYKKKRWYIDGDVFAKKINGLSSKAFFFSDAVNAERIYNGTRLVKGMDLFVKKRWGNFRFWTTYSFMDIRDRFDGLNENKAFHAGNEIRHSFDISVLYKRNHYSLAAGWHWNTGRPYTEAVGKYDGNNMPYWEYDEINGSRLESNHSLDISGAYRFYLNRSHSTKVKAGFSIHNVYNRINTVGVTYHKINEPNGLMTRIEQHNLGFTPNVFFRLYID